MKIFFLLNPSKQKKVWGYRERAAQTARRYGASARFGQVDRTRPESTEHLLSQACEEDCERIVVIGGDGSLHRAVNALDKLGKLSQKEIAIVPAGTCNDLGRAMGLSASRFDKALQLACTGKPRETDLGRMSWQGGSALFLNNAGFGRRVQPKVNRRVRPFRTLRSFLPNPLKATWERGSLEGTFYLGLACNGPFFSGGLHFSKSVRINDGYLDIYLFPSISKWRLLPLLVAGKLGRPVRSRQMIALRVQQLAIEAQTELWPQADGEPAARATRSVSFALADRKVSLIAPVKSFLWAL
jgi:diacylglycerol kinase (ATP)